MDAEIRSRLKALYEEKVVPMNDEFQRERHKASAQVQQVIIGGVVLFALLYFALKYFDSDEVLPHGYILGTVVGGVFLWVWGLCYGLQRQNSTNFRKTVIPLIIPLVDPGLKYDMGKKMMARYYSESRLYRDYDRYRGSDLFYGTYHGVHLKFSRLVTEQRTKSSNSSSYSYSDIFRGIFVILEFNKECHSLTLVKQDKTEKTLGRGISGFFQKMDSSLPGKLIRMENPEFEKEFIITTMDEVEARYQLTPSLMERILKMKKRLSPLPVELSFSNSKLYIGIPTRDSFFEFRGKTAELEDVMRIYEEIWSFASIIDDLNLTRRIWTKE